MTSRTPTRLSLRYKYGKKRKKASCIKKPYGKINYYMLFIFSKGGGRGQHHFSAQHFNRGGGSRYSKFLHGRSIFQGPDVIGPIPMEPYTTCDFPLGPGLPAPSGSVLAPSLGSVWICLFFLFFTSQSMIFQLRRDGSSCVEQVLS